MEPVSPTTDDTLLASVRRHRGELREAMSAVEATLASAAEAGPEPWSVRMRATLVELSGALGAHIEVTEGPDGLYREILATAPRLSDRVGRLSGEHAEIVGALEELLTLLAADEVDPTAARELGTALLATLARHRQRGADLVFEAFEADIGGEH